MGLRFSKRIRLPGGFRINLSKSGVGFSAGVKGLRFGVGPRGPQMTASLPGTGLSYTTALGGARPRTERAARSEQRRLSVAQRDEARMADAQRAGHEVAVFENRLALLTSMHKESWSAWDWRVIAAAPPPTDPAETERWSWYHRVALGVLDGDVEACQAALQYLGPFVELEEMGSSLEVGISVPWCVEAWFGAKAPDVVPTEALSLTPTGKLSRKKMPASRYWALYQDHVCSAAFRIAREVFALLPIPVVFVHAAVPMVEPSTGLAANVPVLSVTFEREPFLALGFDGIDPSEALAGFEHRMKFKKTTGLSRIEVLTPEAFDVGE